MLKRHLMLAMLGALSWVFLAAGARAAVLTFDIRDRIAENSWSTIANSIRIVPNLIDYGDRIELAETTLPGKDSGHDLITPIDPWGNEWYTYGLGSGPTPNVVLDYLAESGYLCTYHGGPYDRVVYHGSAAQTDDSVFFTFTPDLGVHVRINSFDVQTEDSSTKSGQWWVRQDSITGSILAQGSWSISDGTGLYPLHTIDLSSAGWYEGMLVLEINQTQGSLNDTCFDNIEFEQSVPEPSSLVLLSLGTGVLFLPVLRRRRK